jgi:membrane protein DedA with SNARE-associated domain
MSPQGLIAWGEAVLAGMAQPWVIALVLALTTLLLEDLAIAAGVALATQGSVSWTLAFAAVTLGIALGDLGLYALGRAATRVPWLERRYIGPGSQRLRERIVARLPTAVIVARVVPGLRLLTYTGSGFVRVPLAAFSAWVAVAVTLWTAGLFVASAQAGAWIAARFGIAPALAVALPILLLAAAFPLLRALRRHLHRARP